MTDLERPEHAGTLFHSCPEKKVMIREGKSSPAFRQIWTSEQGPWVRQDRSERSENSPGPRRPNPAAEICESFALCNKSYLRCELEGDLPPSPYLLGAPIYSNVLRLRIAASESGQQLDFSNVPELHGNSVFTPHSVKLCCGGAQNRPIILHSSPVSRGVFRCFRVPGSH